MPGSGGKRGTAVDHFEKGHAPAMESQRKDADLDNLKARDLVQILDRPSTY